MIGEVFSNRYEIIKKIGDGGMALVYSAKDLLLNRLVAVKVLREQYATDSEFIERFHREAQAAASLSHPNVVNVYDVGQIGKTPFIVMEYVEGKNLSEIIKEQGTLKSEYAVNIGIQICSALTHAHRHNIVHRDIKPHNILVTKDGLVKVTDFGIAAVSSISITETGVVLGSVSYFSPEQARGNKVDHQSDLYSLGVVLYEMLCGCVPFRGDTPISIALKHIQELPVPPSKINPDISPELQHIVLKLLSKNPSERFQTARELSVELEKLDTTVRTQKIEINDIEQIDKQKIEEEIAGVPKTQRKVKRKSSFSKFLLVLCIIAVLMYGLIRIFSAVLFPKDVEVPSIIGLSLDEAEIVLENHRLRLTIEAEVFDNKVPENYIISQDPKPHRMKKENQYVSVRVSKGPEYVSMPSFIGQSSREAQLNLTQFGFILGNIIPEITTEHPVNTVIDQTPEPGKEIPLGSAVDLTISQGAGVVATFILPDFRGMDIQDVRKQLSELGLLEGSIIPEYNTIVPKDQVIEQNPPARTEVEVGWKIDLVYSEGLPGQTSPSKTEGVQRWTTDGIWRENAVRIEIPEGIEQEVVIVVDDDFGSRDVYRQTHSGGSSFTYTVKGRGDKARILVYIGGRLFIDRYFVE